MSGRTRGRPTINHADAPLQETVEEQHPSLQFATIEQFTALQDQIFTIMNMLQRVTASPPPAENPPAVEIPPSKTMQTQEITSTSRYSIPANWENLLDEKVDEAIATKEEYGTTNFHKMRSIYRIDDECTLPDEVQRANW
ncbi:hypothetical protein Fot_19262 [Forsythia ovata]|uniref:Uncharacterized protein n=1 Tax=Forsythia ovata TaxID=205694 RepID=A0ABD1VKJ5_9LAMI